MIATVRLRVGVGVGVGVGVRVGVRECLRGGGVGGCGGVRWEGTGVEARGCAWWVSVG